MSTFKGFNMLSNKYLTINCVYKIASISRWIMLFLGKRGNNVLPQHIFWSECQAKKERDVGPP